MQEERGAGTGTGGSAGAGAGAGHLPFHHHHLLQQQAQSVAGGVAVAVPSQSQPRQHQHQQTLASGASPLLSVSGSASVPLAQLSMPLTLASAPVPLPVTLVSPPPAPSTKPPTTSSSSSRSTDARKLAAMTRSPMACVPCRDAKHKCDGSPPPALLNITAGTQQSRMDCLPLQADKRCSRCCSHGLECGWLPRAKLGRPLKRPRGVGAGGKGGANGKASHDKASASASANLVTNDVASAINDGVTTSTAALTTSLASPPLPPAVQSQPPQAQPQAQPFPMRGIVPDMVSLPLEQLYSSAAANEHAVNDAIQTSIADAYQQGSGAGSSAYNVSPTTTTATYPFSAFSDRTPTPANMPMPLITTDVSTQSNIRTGLKAFFTQGPRFCLAFVPLQEERFLRCLDRWSGILLNPSDDGVYGRQPPIEARDALTLAQLAACTGWKLFRHDYARGIHAGLLQAGRVGLREIMGRPLPLGSSGIVHDDVQSQTHTPNYQQIAYSLQALLVGCTIEYGLDHVPRAGELLDRATAMVLALDLHHFDAASGGVSTNRLSAQVVSGDLADDFRRIFWELCVIQTMFNTSTTGDARTCFLNPQNDLNLGQIQINFPGGDSHSDLSDYGLRIRAASLLLESVQPAPPGPSRMPRMQSLKTMLTNLAVYARHRFVTAETEQGLEVAYTACLMLNAAKVQLVRLTFFPAWNYALKSCSFEVGGGGESTSASATTATATMPTHTPRTRARCVTLHWPKEAIRNAILDIVAAADDIMELTDLDNKPRWRSRHAHSWEPPSTPLLSHSPFHACPQVIASFGYRAAATLYKDLAESAATPGKWMSSVNEGVGVVPPSSTTTLALSSPPNDTSTTTTPPTPTQRTMQERYNDALWRHRAVLSNMSLAHSALVSGSELWPIAGRLAAEVANCRRSVDHDGPLSVTIEEVRVGGRESGLDLSGREGAREGGQDLRAREGGLDLSLHEGGGGGGHHGGGGEAAFPQQSQQHDINSSAHTTTHVEGGSHDVPNTTNGEMRNWYF